MNFIENYELKKYQSDVKSSEKAIEADKQEFKKKIINEIGPAMIKELSKKEKAPNN